MNNYEEDAVPVTEGFQTAKPVQELRARLNQTPRDPFRVGDVLRWTALDRYTYAAIKTPVGWYTTSNNLNVPKQVDFDELVEILNRSETTDVLYAVTWEEVI